MEIRDDEISIDKPPSQLDELILDVVDVLESVGIEYAVVSGSVAVLPGRSRATEDIDAIVERFDGETADELTAELRAAGYWRSAMPLDDLHATLSDGLAVRVAEDGHRVPNVELKFPHDRYDRHSLENTVVVRLRARSLRVGSLELQFASKLRMGARTDFEDALYLYHLLESTLNTDRLEAHVDDLNVEDEYDELRTSG